MYYDYQMRKFGDEVLALKFIRYCQGRLTSFTLVTILTAVRHLSRAYILAVTSKADKLPLVTEPVTHDNNTIFHAKA